MNIGKASSSNGRKHLHWSSSVLTCGVIEVKSGMRRNIRLRKFGGVAHIYCHKHWAMTCTTQTILNSSVCVCRRSFEWIEELKGIRITSRDEIKKCSYCHDLFRLFKLCVWSTGFSLFRMTWLYEKLCEKKWIYMQTENEWKAVACVFIYMHLARFT